MSNLKEACKNMVATGQARQIGSGIQVTTPIDTGKLHQLKKAYARTFDARVEEGEARERAAERKLRKLGLRF